MGSSILGCRPTGRATPRGCGPSQAEVRLKTAGESPIFQGPVQEVLSAEEMVAVLAHEMSHYLLYEGWEGEFFVAHQLLKALASDVAADPSHFETVRLFSLYAEIFCDRGAPLHAPGPHSRSSALS